MRVKFWHNRWQNNEIGFHQKEVNTRLIQRWSQLGLKAGDPVFVPLCGKSLDMVWLVQQSHPVLGIEVNPLAVETFFRENELSPITRQEDAFQLWEAGAIRLLCGDYFQLDASRLMDIAGVYDRASLIAFPPHMRKDYVRHMLDILPPPARILLMTLEYAEGAMDGPPFSVLEEEVRELYSGAYVIDRLNASDVLADHPRFQAKGLDWLQEKLYRLTPKPDIRAQG